MSEDPVTPAPPPAAGAGARPQSRLRRALLVPLLLPAWFAPSSILRIFFHRLRGVRIGRGCEIGYHVVIDHQYPQLVRIDDGVAISANACLIAHDHSNVRTMRGSGSRVKPIRVRRQAFVGIGAIILPGVEIGERAVVGAGAVVPRNVEAKAVVAGNPAQPVVASDDASAAPRPGVPEA